ncbi:MAG: insulinase family protein, partial [Muribaculaceae bacterium]|nr:insulinase family protein [Muribaculaceae bacterium]
AYTATDETVYNITSVPTSRTSVTDSCLLILHDWANELLLEDEEIDKERGVIHEEWRSRSSGTQRILEDMLPVIYPGSRYAYRMPIGTMEVVDNFPYQALRDYYEKWYRPDLQGIIVVGDVDAARTAAKIEEMFADIEMPADAAERISIEGPDTPGVIYTIGKDKEQPNAMLYLIWKYDGLPREYRSTIPALVNDYAMSLINIMLNQRLEEMMSRPDTPFAVAQASIGDNYMLSNTKDMFAMLGIAKSGDIRPTMESLYREVLRAKRGGFTQGEFDRAAQEYMSNLEKQYNNRNTQETSALTHKLVRHFIDNTSAADISDTYEIMQQVAPMVTLEAVNQMFGSIIGDDNRVVMAFMPDNEAYMVPTEEELAEVTAKVDGEEIEIFVDEARTDPFIPNLPKPGAVKKTATDAQWGATVWTLSNGAKVMIKPTSFKDNEIRFMAVASEGMSRDTKLASVADFVSYDEMSERYSIGSYTSADISKYLTGKQVSLSPSFSLYSRTFSGNATPKDLPYLMELIYGYFTSVNYNADEFAATKSLYEGLLKNQEASPEYQFQKDLRQALYSSPYLQVLDSKTLEQCTREGIEALTKAQVTNAADYTFIFVGNVDPEALKPLVEQYIATLPANAKKATKPVKAADPAFEFKGGDGTATFTTSMTNPQPYCAILEFATMPVTPANSYLADAAGQILSARLIKTVREEMSAVYSISANGALNYYPGNNAMLQTVFPMNPERKAEVLEVIRGEINNMANEVTEEELSKVKEYLIKNHAESLERNGSWAGAIRTWLCTPSHIDTFNGADAVINAITPADVQNFVKEMNAQGNYRVVILDPEQ